MREEGSHAQPKRKMERATPGQDSRRETRKQDEEGEGVGQKTRANVGG